MGIKFSNNAIGTLASGIGVGDLTIALTAGQGAKFPTFAAGDYSYARLKKSTNEIEIIKITARATDTLTVTRGEDGSTPLTFSAGDEIRITWPRASIEAVRDEARQPAAIETQSGAQTLTSADKLKQKIAEATATFTLPAASALNTGDWIDFKSTTTGLVKIIPAGTDTLDGDAAPTYYRLPAFCECRVMKSGTGAFILARRPQRFVGEVFWYPGVLATALKGTAFADNVLISRTTFAGLFDAYGTTHGVGDGSTTFGKPDMRGRVPVGRDDMGGTPASRITVGVSLINGATIGAAGGDERRPAHSHGITDPGHDHDGTQFFSGGGGATVRIAAAGDVPVVAGVASDTTGITVNTDGAGTSQNVQPSLIGDWLVQL